MAGKVRGGAAESTELAFSPSADHDQVGKVACCGLKERDARIAMGDGNAAIDPVIVERFQCFFRFGSHSIVDTFNKSGWPFAAGVGTPDNRGWHAQTCTERG